MSESEEGGVRVAFDEDGDAVVVRPGRSVTSRELDALLVPRVEDLLAQGVRAFVLDLEPVGALDSMGLGAIVKCNGAARKAGARLVLARVGPRLRQLLSVAMLLQVMPVYDTVDEALAGVKR